MQSSLQVFEKQSKPHIALNVHNQIRVFTPEKISAMVLSKMKENAETYLGKKVVTL